MLQALLENPITLAMGLVGGGLVTLAIQRILNKRGILSYFVQHSRLGLSVADEVFGTVQLTFNDTTVKNLYASQVELTNESLKDFADVEVTVFTRDTTLLSERTETVGTLQVVNWTTAYAQELQVPPGEVVTHRQIDTYQRRRAYLIPTLNRGQAVRFTYLNSPDGDNPPTVWIDIVHKGVKVKFRTHREKTLGVTQHHASIVGGGLGLVLVTLLIQTVESTSIVALISFLYGFTAQLPGAVAIRTWRRIRILFGD